jgi:SUKH-3 immunity protein
MFRFSETSLKLLQHAGWFDGRCIDISRSEELLRKEGYQVSPAIRAFLQEFGELRFVNDKAKPPAAQEWHFCVKEAVSRAIPAKVLEYYSPRAGSQLCVIGDAFNEYILLMMDESGQVYGGYDEEFFFIGKSGKEAIQRLCEGRELEQLD